MRPWRPPAPTPRMLFLLSIYNSASLLAWVTYITHWRADRCKFESEARSCLSPLQCCRELSVRAARVQRFVLWLDRYLMQRSHQGPVSVPVSVEGPRWGGTPQLRRLLAAGWPARSPRAGRRWNVTPATPPCHWSGGGDCCGDDLRSPPEAAAGRTERVPAPCV